MVQTMTPFAETKTMTAGQIDKAVANYRALLEKHAGEFNVGAVQTVLGQPELASEQFNVFRRRVEAVSTMIVRHVIVDRTRTPQQALDATGRRQYTGQKVVDAMPHGEGEAVDFVFFKPSPESYTNGFLSNAALKKEFEFYGLTPDPMAQAAANEADPAFADQHPNGTHWQDANGTWYYAAFHRWDGGGRCVLVYRRGHDWGDRWWFGGVRKYQKQSLDS